VQAKLTSINKKFSYRISNIFFKKIKLLIYFILSCAWIHICKAKLLDRVLKVSDVSTNVNLYKILKLDLGYKELSCIRTSPNYLDHLHKDVFAMIRQLGPPTFFMTFTTCVNNWLIVVKTLKSLYDQYIGKKLRIKKDDSLNIRELVKNDHITCARYYEDRMNSFRKFI
jgi:hypothetical protein